MGVQGNKPEVNVFLAKGFLHGVGALVVEDVEGVGCTVLFYVFVACRPGCSGLQGLLVLEKLGVDGIGVVVPVWYKDDQVWWPSEWISRRDAAILRGCEDHA